MDSFLSRVGPSLNGSKFNFLFLTLRNELRMRGQNENQIGIYGPSDPKTPENQDIRIRGRHHGARGFCLGGTGCGVKNVPVEKTLVGHSILVVVGSSGILKAKQKLNVTFNFDKQDVIDFMKFSKMTMCRASEANS